MAIRRASASARVDKFNKKSAKGMDAGQRKAYGDFKGARAALKGTLDKGGRDAGQRTRKSANRP